MKTNTYTPEEFVAARPRCRTIENAVKYVECEMHNARDYRGIKGNVEEIAKAEGLEAVQCGSTSHSRKYKTTRFAIIKVVAE